MAVTIYVRSADDTAPRESCPSLTLDGPRIVIGRGASCDVRLPDASVSSRHASLTLTAGSVTVADEGSRNGTYVGERKLAPRAPYTLRSGELVRVGRVWLEVRADQRPATRDLSLATRDLALALVSQAMRAMGDDVSPRVRVEEGPDAGAELALVEEDRAYVAGRGDDVELPLADADTSRQHVEIVRRGSAVFVRDCDSKNGSALEAAPLAADRETLWKSGQRVILGSTVLVLEEPAAVALRSIEDADDEALAPADVPPIPSTGEAAPKPAPADAPSSDSAISASAPSAPSAPPSAVSVAKKKKSRVSLADASLVAVAIVIFVCSLAGLVWLLRT